MRGPNDPSPTYTNFKTLHWVTCYCSLTDQRPTYTKLYLQISPSQPESGAQKLLTRNFRVNHETRFKETSYKLQRVAHTQVVVHITHFQPFLGFVL